MYKATMDLGRINSKMQLKFHLMLKDDPIQSSFNQSNGGKKTINAFTFNGNEYLAFSPTQYIEIDISKSGDKNDGYNPDTKITLNKKTLFMMTQKLKQIIEDFKEKDLFWTENGKLIVNKELSMKKRQILRTPNKYALIQHMVVYDTNNQEIEYEGIVFAINSYDNFVMLTYDEVLFLYYELTHLDMHMLSIMVLLFELNTRGEMKNSFEMTDFTPPPKIITEQNESTNIQEVRLLPKISNPNEVPNI